MTVFVQRFLKYVSIIRQIKERPMIFKFAMQLASAGKSIYKIFNPPVVCQKCKSNNIISNSYDEPRSTYTQENTAIRDTTTHKHPTETFEVGVRVTENICNDCGNDFLTKKRYRKRISGSSLW